MWAMKCCGRESFCPILFTKRSKSNNCFVLSIKELRRANSAFFFSDHNLCLPHGQCFSQRSCNCYRFAMKWTNFGNWEKKLLELCAADSEGRTASKMASRQHKVNLCSEQRRQASSKVVGWTGENGCKKCRSSWKQSGQSPEIKEPFTPNHFNSLRWTWFEFDFERFPPKMS